MNVSDISISEFVPLPDVAGMQFTSRVMYQVYLFYKEHDQASYYLIEPSDGYLLESYFDTNNLDVYAMYGIFPHNNAMIISHDREYLLILGQDDISSRESVAKAVEKQKAKTGCSHFSSCAVECDYSNMSQLEIAELSEYLNDVLGDSCVILNYPLQKKAEFVSAQNFLPQYEYVDAGSLLAGKVSHSELIEDRTISLLNLYQRIMEYPDEKDNVVFFLKNEDWLKHSEFAAIAALATLSGSKRFQHSSSINASRFVSYLRSIFRMENMYAEDYFDYVLNYPDLSVILNSKAYVLVKDKIALQREDCVFTCIQMQVDKNTIQSVDGVCSTANYCFSDIRILSLRRKFNLDSLDKNKAEKGMSKLTEIFSKMDSCADIRFDTMKNDLLHVSNALLFEYDEKLYLGCITYVHTEIPFIVYPAAHGFPAFRTKLDIGIANIMDIRIFFDWKEIAAQMIAKGLVKVENCIFRPPSYARGVIISALAVNGRLYSKFEKYTFEDIGIWSHQTRMLRISKILFEHLRKDYLQKAGFITAFGGPHPAVQNAFCIRSDAWR